MSTIVRSEIKELVETIQEQTELILEHSENIPQIEIDLVLENLRKLYQAYYLLDKINSKTTPKTKTLPVMEVDVEKVVHDSDKYHPESENQVQNYLDFIATTFTNEPPAHNDEAHIDQIPKPIIEAEPIFKFMEVKKEEEELHYQGDEKMAAGTPVNDEPKIIRHTLDLPFEEEIKIEEKIEVLFENTEIVEPTKQIEVVPELQIPSPNVVLEPFVEVEKIDLNTSQVKNEVVEKPTADSKKAFNSLKGKPIDSLKKAIGINDKFQFINELFEGNMARYNRTIDQLDNIGELNAALQILKELITELDWDVEDKAFQQLENYLQRRYA